MICGRREALSLVVEQLARYRASTGTDIGSAQGLRLVSADRATTRMRPLVCALSALLANRELVGND